MLYMCWKEQVAVALWSRCILVSLYSELIFGGNTRACMYLLEDDK